MIWTVVLKSGEGFTVYGSSFNRNDEVRKSLRGRQLREDDVAGVIQGNHNVEPYGNVSSLTVKEDYSDQIKAAMTAPDLDPDFTDRVMDEVMATEVRDAPSDEFGRPFNDPSKW